MKIFNKLRTWTSYETPRITEGGSPQFRTSLEWGDLLGVQYRRPATCTRRHVPRARVSYDHPAPHSPDQRQSHPPAIPPCLGFTLSRESIISHPRVYPGLTCFRGKLLTRWWTKKKSEKKMMRKVTSSSVSWIILHRDSLDWSIFGWLENKKLRSIYRTMWCYINLKNGQVS